jgi:hypothetical protein
MSIELDRPGGGVAAFMLSLSTLLALQKNGTLADDELADIVEQSLARLKTIDAATSVRSQAAWGSARTLLRANCFCRVSNLAQTSASVKVRCAAST